MNVEVIFIKDVEEVAELGEIKYVRRGYARNYLLPMGLAQLATKEQKGQLAGKVAEYRKEQEREQKKAKQLADKLSSLTLKLEVETNEADQLFGAITKSEIAEALQKSAGDIPIDRHDIELEDQISALGKYEFSYRTGTNVRATIALEVSKRG
jgi:large subunit ribosomal protein L9